jgi:hypothetical protein
MSFQEVDRIIDAAFVDSFMGWCTPAKAKRMARIVYEAGNERPPTCVELGVFGGRGVVAMGLPIKHCLRGQGVVHGLDPYTASAALEGTNAKENDDWWSKLDYQAVLAHARGKIKEFGLDDIVKLVIKRSQDAVDEYADASIDVLHQDSNHSAEISCAEVAMWMPKVRAGAFWIFDDVNWATTKFAQTRLTEHHKFSVVEMHDTWAVFQKPH